MAAASPSCAAPFPIAARPAENVSAA
jgi:hypothetical protein